MKSARLLFPLGVAALLCSQANAFEFTVVPKAPGPQFVRASVPVRDNEVGKENRVTLTDGKKFCAAGIRPVAHGLGNAGELVSRRVLVSFPYTFEGLGPVRFESDTSGDGTERNDAPKPLTSSVEMSADRILLHLRGGLLLDARLQAPSMTLVEETGAAPSKPLLEEVEDTLGYRWRRWQFPDPSWPRMFEVREDASGAVVVVAFVQRLGKEDGFAPVLAWEIQCKEPVDFVISGGAERPIGAGGVRHGFEAGETCEVMFSGAAWKLQFPQAPLKRRGGVSVRPMEPGFQCVHTRCQEDDKVPMQPHSWERIEFVVSPSSSASLSSTLEPPHTVSFPRKSLLDAHGALGLDESALPGPLVGLLNYHRDAIRQSAATGHDWGNVTSFQHGSPSGGVFGMNRLNHNGAVFEEYWRSGDARLRETALLWCENFMDRSIWWAPLSVQAVTDDRFGGTRYNNVTGQNKTPLSKDFMWRSNDSVNFCTKGYDSFLLAYEETGDTRLLTAALEGQLRYVRGHVFANRGECRNIGDVRDFVRLFELTNDRAHLDQALRLFRELREKLSPEGLFDQGGKPLHPILPFIETDAMGSKFGYAKPYIIGYALAGLPALARYFPDEPRLRQVVRAVAGFLAASMDPAGGWRYPHPRSSAVLFSQALEHAWQLVQADRLLGPDPRHLDAIEAVLRQRLHGWMRTGRILSGLGGFEIALGRVKSQQELESLYATPTDRPMDQDYTNGPVGLGSAPPEGLVYLGEVLAFYLMHRPSDRLLAPPDPASPLGKILARVPPSALTK